MRFHTLRREQWTPRPLDEVFTFFSDAGNLADLTPPFLGFRILTPAPIRMGRGARIKYRLGVHGILVHWTTEIREWQPPHRFIDVQLSGPYALWHHTHRFEDCDGGTRLRDVVRYRLPFGILGRALNGLMVSRDVRRIFDYREKRVRELFGDGRKEAGR